MTTKLIILPKIILFYVLKHNNNNNESYEKANETEYVFKINFNRIPFTRSPLCFVHIKS